MVDGIVVFSVPLNWAAFIAIDGVNSIGSDERTSTVNQTVSTFPYEICDVIRNTHLPMNQRWNLIVECTAIAPIKEVEHGKIVLVAIIKANRTAITIPYRTSLSVQKTKMVVVESHALECLIDNRRIVWLFDTHPCFCTSLLDTIHQVEEHLGKVRHCVYR